MGRRIERCCSHSSLFIFTCSCFWAKWNKKTKKRWVRSERERERLFIRLPSANKKKDFSSLHHVSFSFPLPLTLGQRAIIKKQRREKSHRDNGWVVLNFWSLSVILLPLSSLFYSSDHFSKLFLILTANTSQKPSISNNLLVTFDGENGIPERSLWSIHSSFPSSQPEFFCVGKREERSPFIRRMRGRQWTALGERSGVEHGHRRTSLPPSLLFVQFSERISLPLHFFLQSSHSRSNDFLIHLESVWRCESFFSLSSQSRLPVREVRKGGKIRTKIFSSPTYDSFPWFSFKSNHYCPVMSVQKWQSEKKIRYPSISIFPFNTSCCFSLIQTDFPVSPTFSIRRFNDILFLSLLAVCCELFSLSGNVWEVRIKGKRNVKKFQQMIPEIVWYQDFITSSVQTERKSLLDESRKIRIKVTCLPTTTKRRLVNLEKNRGRTGW